MAESDRTNEMSILEKNKPKIGDVVLLPSEELLASLHSLVQNVKIHHVNNNLVISSVTRFLQAVGALLEDSEDVTVQVAKGSFFVMEEKLGYRRGSAFLVDNMLKYFDQRGLMGFRLYPAIAGASTEEIVDFAKKLNDSARQKNPMDWLVLRLEETKIQWVAILQPEVMESTDAAAGLGAGQKSKSQDVSAPGTDSGPGGGGLVEGDGFAGEGGFAGGESGEGGGSGDGEGEKGSGDVEIEVPGQRSPRKVYAYALESMREVADKISINQRAGIRNAVRIVQNMVEEVVLQEQPLLLAMSTIRIYDDYTFSHSVNVAILSMYLGKQIGVSKETMESLGICGLFHDLGKVLIPQEILNKEEPLSDNEFDEIRQHSLNSVRLIARLRASASRKARIFIPPFEHHLKFDLTGYPNIGWNKSLSLCGRILAICDVYDALTSPRVYRKEALSADRALGLMLEKSGTIFDPLLLKVFINMLGVYPIGTLLELDNGDIGLVSKAPSTHVMNRPWVILLRPNAQGGFDKGEEVDLAEKDSAGFYYRMVSSSVHPAVFNIQPAEFLTS